MCMKEMDNKNDLAITGTFIRVIYFTKVMDKQSFRGLQRSYRPEILPDPSRGSVCERDVSGRSVIH